ncbi:hypothetical protein WA026_023288 [Henosepilachna vigintioctopunctata]|uniref:Uncharacterized protein n=1 Tax=Henosepilachna vigintioctopunctata TaxID=420089 RepID=A0AAW1TZ25_9CUCU
MSDKEMEWNILNSNTPPDEPGGTKTDKYQEPLSLISVTPNLLSQSINLINDKSIQNDDYNSEMFNICSQQANDLTNKDKNTVQNSKDLTSLKSASSQNSIKSNNVQNSQISSKSPVISSAHYIQ